MSAPFSKYAFRDGDLWRDGRWFDRDLAGRVLDLFKRDPALRPIEVELEQAIHEYDAHHRQERAA